jgi:hypothetical protein
MLRRSPLTHCVAVLGLTSTLLTGCEGFSNLFGDAKSRVNFFVGHHASPDENGNIPDLSSVNGMRVFENDSGWIVSLTQGYVVTSGATLHGCDNRMHEADLFWGTLAEDFSQTDFDVSSLGQLDVKKGNYCKVTVHYGPYDVNDGYAARGGDILAGKTIFLAGFADRGEERVLFEVQSTGSLAVDVDLSAIEDGDPLHVSGDESFPVELTLTKTYDRFFDGIDFSELAALDMDEQVMAVLQLETRVTEGTDILY